MDKKKRIINYISKQVQSGVLNQGDQLYEEKIAAELGVSRTPIREALQVLYAQGYIVKEPNRGYFVKKWTVKERSEAFEVISTLDFLSAKKSLEYLEDEDFDYLEECIEKMNVAIKYFNYKDYVDAQHKFHNIYVEKCGNSKLIDTINSLLYTTMQITYVSENYPDKKSLFKLFEKNNNEHSKILECMKNQDIINLEKTIKEHWLL